MCIWTSHQRFTKMCYSPTTATTTTTFVYSFVYIFLFCFPRHGQTHLVNRMAFFERERQQGIQNYREFFKSYFEKNPSSIWKVLYNLNSLSTE